MAHHLGASASTTRAVAARAASVAAVPDDVPAPVAALLGCALLTGGGAVVNAGHPRPGEPVVVVGPGGGMAAVFVAAALGHEVLGVDALPQELELARARALGGDAPGGGAGDRGQRARGDRGGGSPRGPGDGGGADRGRGGA